ncbi:hypothetical protein D9M73_205010 [compost metagenome]
MVAIALAGVIRLAPSSLCASHWMPSATGNTTARLPTIAATLERIMAMVSSMNISRPSGRPAPSSRCASAGPVMAGCLVASVKCAKWMARKLPA